MYENIRVPPWGRTSLGISAEGIMRSISVKVFTEMVQEILCRFKHLN